MEKVVRNQALHARRSRVGLFNKRENSLGKETEMKKKEVQKKKVVLPEGKLTHKDARNLVEKFLSQPLSAEELEDLDKHLADCSDCREFLEQQSETERLLGWFNNTIDSDVVLSQFVANRDEASQRKVDALMVRGREYLKNKDFIAAKLCFGNAARLGNVEGVYELGVFFEKVGSKGKAIECYEKAAKVGHPGASKKLKEERKK